MSYSIIKDYTNSRGKTHQAHFSPSGKYLGPVSKRGDKPFLLVHAKPKIIKLFKIPEVQDKPVIIEDCDESEEETESETESEEETESESESEEETESDYDEKEHLQRINQQMENYPEGGYRGEFTEGRYLGIDGIHYEIVKMTPKSAYVCVVQKDGTLRKLTKKNDSANPTGRRLISISNSIWNGCKTILIPLCKIK